MVAHVFVPTWFILTASRGYQQRFGMRRADRITASQVRAARALLGWSQERLADRSGVSRRTITHIENNQVVAVDDSQFLLRKAFEEAGVIFLREGGLSGVVAPDRLDEGGEQSSAAPTRTA